MFWRENILYIYHIGNVPRLYLFIWDDRHVVYQMLTLAICHCLFPAIKRMTDLCDLSLWFYPVLQLFHLWRWIGGCQDTSIAETTVRLHTHILVFLPTSGPRAVKDRVTWWERKHSSSGIHGTINEVVTLYIYLQVIRIQGSRSHIPSLPTLSKERSFSLVYIEGLELKAHKASSLRCWQRSLAHGEGILSLNVYRFN